MRTAALALAAGLVLAPISVLAESGLPVVTVHKSPTCGCCGAWAEHMRENGFTVVEKNTEGMPQVKALAGVPQDLASCHTAVVDGYVIEGHVPAGDVRRLLDEAPNAAGLAVPGMPPSSPGMDVPGYDTPYQTLLFTNDGQSTVYSRH
jgi:hypothetical protein